MSYKVEQDWTTKAGLRAVCLWGDEFGHRCGYVGVDKSHPLYEAHYGKPSRFLKKMWEKAQEGPIGKRGIISVFLSKPSEPRPDSVFDVHGGLTFSGGGENSKYPIKSDLWWFGFDCAHLGDSTAYSPEGVLRSKEYVIKECERLAGQLVEVTREG